MEPLADYPTIEVTEPPEDKDTCRFTLDRDLAPDGALYFASADEAKDDPLVSEVFKVRHVQSVLVKKNIILVSRSGGTWAELIPDVEDAIFRYYDGDLLDLDNDWPAPPPHQAIAGVHAGPPPGMGAPEPQPVERDLTPEEADLKARVSEILDNEINPSVAMHGGFIRLIDVKGRDLYIYMGGGCQGCGMAAVTLRQGVESTIRARVPEIDKILDNTDHAAGTNPYF